MVVRRLRESRRARRMASFGMYRERRQWWWMSRAMVRGDGRSCLVGASGEGKLSGESWLAGSLMLPRGQINKRAGVVERDVSEGCYSLEASRHGKAWRSRMRDSTK